MNTSIHAHFAQSLLSCMVKAGWIFSFMGYSTTNYSLQWTPMGEQRVRFLQFLGADLSAEIDDRIPPSISELARGANPLDHPWVDWSKVQTEYTVLLLNQIFEELSIHGERERLILLFRIAASWVEGGKSLRTI